MAVRRKASVEPEVTAEEAVEAAKAAGDDVFKTEDESGQEFEQRPLRVTHERAHLKQLLPGPRVRVYNKLNARLYCSDCNIGPNEEQSILEEDLKHPNIRARVIRVAE